MGSTILQDTTYEKLEKGSKVYSPEVFNGHVFIAPIDLLPYDGITYDWAKRELICVIRDGKVIYGVERY